VALAAEEAMSVTVEVEVEIEGTGAGEIAESGVGVGMIGAVDICRGERVGTAFCAIYPLVNNVSVSFAFSATVFREVGGTVDEEAVVVVSTVTVEDGVKGDAVALSFVLVLLLFPPKFPESQFVSVLALAIACVGFLTSQLIDAGAPSVEDSMKRCCS
jgi:hypothetical protein